MRFKRSLPLAVFVAGYLAIFYAWLSLTASAIGSSTASTVIALGDIAGLTTAYCALWQLVLMSRTPILEQTTGRAQLVRVHKLNGYTVITLLTTHVLLISIGYALLNNSNAVHQFITIVTTFPHLIRALIAFLLFFIIVGTSITIVRRRLRYESWYLVHLFTYLAIFLAFFHQVANGNTLISHPVFRAIWYVLYALAFGLIGTFKFARPLYRLGRYGYRVERVVPETANTYSIYISGRHIERLMAQAGQFAIWRFLDKGLWWQAHPFSFSSDPASGQLRVTVKAVGDFTTQLKAVKPGTPVLIDAPLGRFTLAERRQDKLLFIAGGSGITPLRAMLAALPAPHDVVLLYSCRTPEDIALKAELDKLAQSQHFKVQYVVGDGAKAGYVQGPINAELLKRLVPDARAREAYICGPPPMMAAMEQLLRAQGAPRDLIHSERFAF